MDKKEEKRKTVRKKNAKRNSSLNKLKKECSGS